MLDGCRRRLIDSIIVSEKQLTSFRRIERITTRCVSVKFGPILNCFNIRNIFETKHTLRGALMETSPDRDAQQTRRWVCSMFCCGKCYINKRDFWKYSLRITENLTDHGLQKSKLGFARRGPSDSCEEAKVWQFETSYTCLCFLIPLFIEVWISLPCGLTSFKGKSENDVCVQFGSVWEYSKPAFNGTIFFIYFTSIFI